MEKKYSKNNLKKKRWIKILIVFFAVIFLTSISFLIFINVKNNIVFERIDTTAKEVTDDVVKNSTPIIVNNVVVGATYNKQWVAQESYYFRNESKNNIDIDVYTSEGKKGKYKVTEQIKDDTSPSVIAKTTNPDLTSEFLAVTSSDKNIMTNPATKIDNVTNEDIETVKDALGIYKIFNSSVKINSIYNITLDSSNRGLIYCVTNEPGTSDAYSAVIYVSNTGDKQIIKYNYINNTKDSSNWPIYDFKFIADFNQDGVNEIVLQEIKEFDVDYDIIEYKDKKFTEVLSTSVKI